jgi:hypothetical protein
MRDLLNIVFYFGERALFKRECRLLVKSTVYADWYDNEVSKGRRQTTEFELFKSDLGRKKNHKVTATYFRATLPRLSPVPG